MRLVFLLALTCSLLSIKAQAAFFYAPNSCEKAIKIAEEKYQIPQGLLQAIGIVESGKKNTHKPWPWSVGTTKKSHYPSSKETAISLAKKLQATGIKNIDVGCMQINLKAHPKAFKHLKDAFDPHKNVTYAAKLIKFLKTKKNTWNDVIGLYHSNKKKFYSPYKKRVYLAWFSFLTKKIKEGRNTKKTYRGKVMFKGSKELPKALKLNVSNLK